MADERKSDVGTVSLANLPAAPGQGGFAFAVAAVLLVGLAVAAPFASIQFPPVPAFIPVLETAIFLNDLITSTLLFTQYLIAPSRAILALAAGYLFTALIIVPHLLTYPTVFAPSGLLGAGLQSTAWLYYIWHAALPAAVICYVFFKDADRVAAKKTANARSIVYWTVVILVALVCGLTWLVIAEDRLLPVIISPDTFHANRFNVVIISSTVVLIVVTAISSLWAYRRTLLDYWLLLMLLAVLSEMMLTSLLISGRWTFGFYAGRAFALFTSMAVLILLLGEVTRLYARLAQSTMILQRERNNKFMTVEAIAASIAHEVKQPLAAISANLGAALELLHVSPPNLLKAEVSLSEAEEDVHRAADAIDGIRSLVGRPGQPLQAVSMNDIALEILDSLRSEMQARGILVSRELTSDLPLVAGHKSQLHEVLLNLVNNALEAMDSTTGRSKKLEVIVRRHNADAIVVAVKDEGPGIDAKQLDSIFDAFVTTKPNGMGMGLAICRAIIERHGGQLSALSDGKSGALFQFVLPIRAHRDDATVLG